MVPAVLAVYGYVITCALSLSGTVCCCCCRFVQACAVRGVLVLLDLHRLAAAKDIPELWYDEQYDEAAVLQAWKTMVLRWAAAGYRPRKQLHLQSSVLLANALDTCQILCTPDC